MKDERKTKAQLIAELQALRAELSGSAGTAAGTALLDGLSANQLYRALAETSPDAIMLLSPDGRLHWANARAAEVMGYDDVDDLLSSVPDLSLLAAPESLEHTEPDVKRVLRNGSARRLERFGRRKDGTTFPVEISASLVPGDAGEALGLILVIRDMTEQKQAEQRYRTLIETSPDAISMTDLQGNVLMANQRTAKLFGFESTEQMLGEIGNAIEFIAEEDRERNLATVTKLLAEGGVASIEQTMLRRDGARFPAEATFSSVVLDDNGAPSALIGVMRDITERRESERKIRDSEEKFRNLVQTANDAIFLADAETGTILEANQAAEKLLGRPLDQIIGLHQSELHPESEAQRYTHVFRDHIASGRGMISGLEAQHADGRRIPIEISARVFELGGKPMLQGIFRDITDRKQIEAVLAERNAALTRANEELHRLHRAKDEFIATVSHELRTPLVTGLGYIELLLEGLLGPISQNTEVKMGVALKNLKRLSRLIDDILDYQRLIRSDLREQPEPAAIELASLLREGLAEFVVRTGRSMTTIKADLADGLPLVRADKDMLRRVIANLLDNAERHAGAKANITLGAELDGNRVRISVVDNGVGMPSEVRDKAFEPFVRANPDSPGSGLGLAIVREILEAHGSSVSLQSEPDRGTAVSFTLPTTSAEGKTDAAAPARAVREHADVAGTRILVVDDDADMLDFMNLALTQRGYRVQLASSAERALAYLDRDTTDLILLDISLPGLSGDELCRRLKNRPATSDIPVAMFTARAEESIRQRAEAAGCDRYLVKPVMLADLLATLREMLVRPD